MQRRGAGNTTVSRVKSLYLHVQQRHGRADADGFLAAARLDRDLLDDETRPLSVELWHGALEAFASRWGRDEIPETSAAVVVPDNLGVWTRVLRGARTPADAFRQLEHHGGDEVLTERWHTLGEGPSWWRGQVRISAQAPHERDGLCALARATELSAIPLLFGYEPGQVEQVRSEGEKGTLEYVVRWQPNSQLPIVIAAAFSLAVGGGVALLGDLPVLPVAGASALAGMSAGILLVRDRARRIQSRLQMSRLQALERAATLRDSRERSAIGFSEGGVVAGQYRLGEKLGAGASGAIWEATRLADGEIVAIKLLRTAVAHDTVAADRLRREAAALGLAWHPNVVEVYDDGHLPDGTSYLVMERLYGESLAERIRRQGALNPSDVLPMALQVCDALGAVHAAGVVHRDLKPSNIFLARGGHDADDPATASLSRLPTGERVKLLDFGVAQVEWAETRLTNMGAPLGTPGYMSPEQEEGSEIDQRSDVYALGGVLYECLTGQPPPLSNAELWERRDSDVAFPSGVQRALQSISEPWRRVIEKAMAPLPRERFNDARAIREAIAELAVVRLVSQSQV